MRSGENAIIESYGAYVKGIKLFPPANIKVMREELKELVEDKTLEEFFDVLHTACRIFKIPNFITYFVAYPTARKHAKRVMQYGCPRSRRAHSEAGKRCVCNMS
jgi:hypothetical protein